MSPPLVLAIDQGTTSSRAIVFDGTTQIVAVAQETFPQIYPRDGWVEHDPEAIWQSTLKVCREALRQVSESNGKVVAIGITNQRETTVVWDRETGNAIHNAIVWQDRRTADVCDELARKPDHVELVQQRTGLLLDPYFSASKVAWVLDHVEGARTLAEQGRLAFGTIDCFLIWRLTDGQVHATDATNASRTSLYNIVTEQWDDELLALFRVPRSVLPQVRDCDGDFGVTARGLLDEKLPIRGVAGDQQAATIGQCCFSPGDIKSTYGTGCFVIMNTGGDLVLSQHRLLSTIAYRINGHTAYALEGSIFIAGAAVQWLRDELGIVKSAPDTEAMARELDGNDGVYLVPAFTGLGAPHWDPDARGAVIGLTRGTGAKQIVRAALESVCYQTVDLFSAMQNDGITPSALRVDGGMVGNDWMLQFLADVLELELERPQVMETTALGAAYLAGKQLGVFGTLDEFSQTWRIDQTFSPTMDAAIRQRLVEGWQQAVSRVLTR